MKHIILFTILLSVYSDLYAACACEKISLDLAVYQSKNIFSAKVKNQNGNLVTLEKLKVFKGDNFATLELGTSPCPLKLKSGASYVFFVEKAVVKSECEPHFEIQPDSAHYQSFLTKFKK